MLNEMSEYDTVEGESHAIVQLISIYILYWVVPDIRAVYASTPGVAIGCFINWDSQQAEDMKFEKVWEM